MRLFILFFGVLLAVLPVQPEFSAEGSAFATAPESFVQNISGSGLFAVGEAVDASEDDEKELLAEIGYWQVHRTFLPGKSQKVARYLKDKTVPHQLLTCLFTNLSPPRLK